MKAEKFSEVKPPHMQRVVGIYENGDEVEVLDIVYDSISHICMDAEFTPIAPPTRWFLKHEFKDV